MHSAIDRLRLARLQFYDAARFAHNSGSGMQPHNSGNVRARLMYYTHAIEKGLSRSDFRPDFGTEAIRELGISMSQWLRIGDPKDAFFANACSVLEEYFSRHRDLGVDVSNKKALLPVSVQVVLKPSEFETAGTLEISPCHLNARTLEDVARSRHSVREFSEVPVPLDSIRRVVRLAQTSPSVCNRQPVRVHLYTDMAQVEEALRLQGGLSGFRVAPRLLAITCDLTTFLKSPERNEAYVDGALFAMTLLLALEAEDIAACPLSAMLSFQSEKSIRELLEIPDSHAIVMFIAVGSKPSKVSVPKSFRDHLSNVLIEH